MKLDSNNHSVFMMHYHLIMCVKYRRNVISDEISASLRATFEKIAPDYNIVVEEWNHDQDHVHILFRGQPNSEISKFINAYKSASSRLVKKGFSGDQAIPLERNVLVKKLLPADYRRRSGGCYQAVHPDAE